MSVEDIKQESDLEELQFVWTNLSKEVIDLASENGDDLQETAIMSTTETYPALPLIREASPLPVDAYLDTASRDVPVLSAEGNHVTKPRNAKVPWTAERRAKIEQIQRALAEKAYGRPVPGKIDGLFSTIDNQTAAQDSNVARPLVVPASDGDFNAWIWEEVQDEPDAALKFAGMKEKYEAEVRSKTNSWMDDIKFLSAEKEERARLNRLDMDFRRADTAPITSEDKDSGEEETLFLPEGEKRKGQVLPDTGLSLASGDE